MSAGVLRVFSYGGVRRVLVWAGAVTVWSCGGSTSDATSSDIGSVAVTPSSVTVLVGQQQPVQAVVNDANGRPVSGATVVWSVKDASIALVSTTGVITGVAIGQTEVAANVNGKSGITAVTVSPPPVASVVVLPQHVDAVVGAHSTFTAVAYDNAGLPLSGRTFVWASSNTSVATVDGTGDVTAVAPGTATITSASEGKSGAATITVSLVPVASVTVTPDLLSLMHGESMKFTATARDASGNVVSGRPVQWASSSSTTATVATDGTVTGVSDGTAAITATISGVVGTATVKVSNVPVGSVTVSPSPVAINQNTTQQLTAVVRDIDNQILARIVTWSTSNSSLATVTANGLVTGVNPGTATITATTAGQSGTAAVTVNRVPVASLVLQPSAGSIRVGSTLTVAAIPNDALGLSLGGRVVTWKSSSTQIATVSAAGVVTGVAAGRSTITATCEGVTATMTVDVGVVVGTVTLTPATATMRVGLTLTLVPTVKDANGTVTTDRAITWSSSSTAAATVSSTGVVIGVNAGAATITATSEGKSGTASITVIVPPVSTVTVQPSTATVALGNTTTLSAVTKDDLGNVLIGRLVTWTSSNTAIATVNSAGVVTAVNHGSATITATSEGKSGTATVTVP